MEVLVLALSQGVIMGIIAYDMAQRAKDKKDLLKARQDATEASQKLSELHNKTTMQIQAISDKVNAHEMFLKTAQPTNNNVMKRF